MNKSKLNNVLIIITAIIAIAVAFVGGFFIAAGDDNGRKPEQKTEIIQSQKSER